jgi:predicted nucleic acid-binding protein
MEPANRSKWSFEVAVSSKKFHTQAKQLASLREHSFEELIEKAESTQLEAEDGITHDEFVSRLPSDVRSKYLSAMEFLRQINSSKGTLLSPDVRFVFNPRGGKPVIEGQEEIPIDTVTQVSSSLGSISDLSDESIFGIGLDPYNLDSGVHMPYEDLLPHIWNSVPRVSGPDLRGIQNLVTHRSPEEQARVEQEALVEARNTVVYMPDVTLNRLSIENSTWAQYYQLAPLSTRPPVEVNEEERAKARVRIEEVKAQLKAQYLDDEGRIRLVILHGNNDDLCLKVLSLKLNSGIIEKSLMELADTSLNNIADVRKLREYERLFAKGALSESDMGEIRQEYLKIHPKVGLSMGVLAQMLSGLLRLIPREILSIGALSDLLGSTPAVVEQLLLERFST